MRPLGRRNARVWLPGPPPDAAQAPPPAKPPGFIKNVASRRRQVGKRLGGFVRFFPTPKAAAAAPPSDRVPAFIKNVASRRRVVGKRQGGFAAFLQRGRETPLDKRIPFIQSISDFRRRIKRGVPSKWYRPLRLAPTTIITVDAAASTGRGSAITSLTFSATTGSGSNRLLLVALHNRAPGGHAASTSVTWNSVALTFAGRAVVQSDHSIELWYLLSPDAATTANVVASFPDTRAVVGSATHWGNVDQANPIGTLVQGGATTGTPTATTSTAAVGDMVLSFIQRITSELVEAPGDMTEIYQVNTVAGDVKGAAAYQASDGNRPTTWKYITSTYWTVLATDLNPAPPSAPISVAIHTLQRVFTTYPYRQARAQRTVKNPLSAPGRETPLAKKPLALEQTIGTRRGRIGRIFWGKRIIEAPPIIPTDRPPAFRSVVARTRPRTYNLSRIWFRRVSLGIPRFLPKFRQIIGSRRLLRKLWLRLPRLVRVPTVQPQGHITGRSRDFDRIAAAQLDLDRIHAVATKDLDRQHGASLELDRQQASRISDRDRQSSGGSKDI